MNSDLSLAMVYSGGGLPPGVLATVPALLEPFPAGLLVPGVGEAAAGEAGSVFVQVERIPVSTEGGKDVAMGPVWIQQRGSAAC